MDKEFNAAWMHRSAQAVGKTTDLLIRLVSVGVLKGFNKIKITVQASDYWTHRNTIKDALECLADDVIQSDEDRAAAKHALKDLYGE